MAEDMKTHERALKCSLYSGIGKACAAAKKYGKGERTAFEVAKKTRTGHKGNNTESNNKRTP